jgi:hypothetical protein
VRWALEGPCHQVSPGGPAPELNDGGGGGEEALESGQKWNPQQGSDEPNYQEELIITNVA